MHFYFWCQSKSSFEFVFFYHCLDLCSVLCILLVFFSLLYVLINSAAKLPVCLQQTYLLTYLLTWKAEQLNRFRARAPGSDWRLVAGGGWRSVQPAAAAVDWPARAGRVSWRWWRLIVYAVATYDCGLLLLLGGALVAAERRTQVNELRRCVYDLRPMSVAVSWYRRRIVDMEAEQQDDRMSVSLAWKDFFGEFTWTWFPYWLT